MIILLGSLALTTAPATQASPIEFIDAGQFGRCAEHVLQARAPSTAARFSRLGDLPDARMEKPVTRIMRYGAACAAAPLIVRNAVSR